MEESWHELSAGEVLAKLAVAPDKGLTTREAARRLERAGPNALPEAKRPGPLSLFAAQFKEFMVVVLLGAAAVSLALGERLDAVAIAAIVMLNAALGFIQEYRAERSLTALQRLAAPAARVLRDGHQVRLPAAELVPGDIILLEAGDRVPADCRVLEAFALGADEAMLTGESRPVSKHAVALAPGPLALGELKNMVFMGTSLTRGHAKAAVTATGSGTQMGRIAGLLAEAEEGPTPLQERLTQLGRWLVVGCLAICALMTVTGVLHGHDPYRMLLAGVSLAVAAIPEGLPAIVTIALAVGVQRMARRNSIVRRLPAVETLGCATVICADKTGTLTENELMVRRILLPGLDCEVTGRGYEPRGQFTSGGRAVRGEDLERLLSVGALCCNAVVQKRDRHWRAEGDPTEAAIVVALAKYGIDPKGLAAAEPRVHEVPFTSENRYMATVHAAKGGRLVCVKGAPETVLERCERLRDKGGDRPLTRAEAARWTEANARLAEGALRVLAIACRRLPEGELPPDEELATGLTFLGLIAMMDPPRPECRQAVALCGDAGIAVTMITGDHLATAVAVAAELGIMEPGGLALTGADLDGMSPIRLSRVVERVRVFARVSPAHKLQIVRALRRRGHVVAMTGDGVNDAPAVKEADIGIAMGASGTDVTREASAMVLADDNFASIVAAVEEGRGIYANMRKFIRYLLACNVGEVLVMFLGVIGGLPLPLVPIQLLWVNLVTDGLPALALGVDPPEPGNMARPPRERSESVFARGLGWRILVRGGLIGLVTLGVFWLGLRDGDLGRARTLAFATLCVSQLFHVFECRSEQWRLGVLNPFGNLNLLGAVSLSAVMLLLAVHAPLLRPVFQTVALSGAEWGLVVLAGGLGVILNGAGVAAFRLGTRLLRGA